MSHELIIVLINAVVLLICYVLVLPRQARANMKKIALNDLLATLVALLIAASLFMGKGLSFQLGPLALSWFWFTLLTYFALELPLMFWYLNKINQENEQ